MTPGYHVLIVCEDPAQAAAHADTIQRAGIETSIAQNTAEAIKKMGLHAFDMIIAEARLKDASGLDFLREARRQMPLALRVAIENAPIDTDRRQLINQIGLAAIFSDGVAAEDVLRLLALEGAVSQAAYSASAMARLDLEKLRKRAGQLEAENTLLAHEVELLEREKERLRKSRATQTPNPDPQQNIDEARIARTAGMILRAMDSLLTESEIILPVLPAVGLEVQRMATDDNCSFEELAQRVELEQGMSARILQVANSPLYAGLERIRNLQQAVTRLGLRETRNLLQAIVAENLFRTRDRSLARLMARLWMHSLCTAYSNENIARTLEIPNSDDYFMLGLLHDIGKLLILKLVSHLRNTGKLSGNDVTEEIVLGLMDACHHQFGVNLMEKWLYSNAFKNVVAHHNDDANIRRYDEPVIVTYYSNLLTRKIGLSLVPYREGQLESADLAGALNMTTGTRLLLEKTLIAIVQKIQVSYFAKPTA